MEAIGEYLKKIESEKAAPVSPEQVVMLSPRQCVEMALTKNAKVAVAEDDLAAAQAKIGQARSGLLPQASASTALIHTAFNENNGPAKAARIGKGLNQVFGLISGQFNPISSLTSSASMSSLTPVKNLRKDSLTIKQVIYAGGQIRAAIRASEFLAQSQEWRKEATLEDLELETKRAYYDCLLARALVRVAERSVKTFERQLSDANQMFEVGMVSHFQVLRAETELGARKAEAVAAKNGARLADANLLRILVMPQDTPIDLEPKLEWLPYLAPMNELVVYANEHRPDILALEKGIEAAKQDQERVRGEYKPKVASQLQYSNTDHGGLTTPDGWTASVGAEWELVAGGRRKAERAEAKARVSSLEHQLEDVQRLVELDVTRSQIQIQDAMAKIQSERGTVDLAREGLRLAELRFQEGVGTQTEVLDAELALTNAQTALVLALHDYAVANASLERATGKSWMKPEEPAK